MTQHWIQRQVKATNKEIEKIYDLCDPDTLYNIFAWKREHLFKWWNEEIYVARLMKTDWHSAAIKKFGKPLVHARHIESNPGIWIFSDFITGAIMIVYSDQHRKNHYKGTSYELGKIANLTDDQLKDALMRFIETINPTPWKNPDTEIMT